MKLAERLFRWWNALCVDLNNDMDDTGLRHRPWPRPHSARPAAPPGRILRECELPPTFSQQRLQEVNDALRAAGRAFGGYQPNDRGQGPVKAPPKNPSGFLAPKPGDTETVLECKSFGRPEYGPCNFKLNGDRTTAVATDYFWNEDMQACPRGVKVQLLGLGGVAVYGTYSGSDFWTAWAPCPKRR